MRLALLLCLALACCGQPEHTTTHPGGAVSASIGSEAPRRRALVDRIDNENGKVRASGAAARVALGGAKEGAVPVRPMWELVSQVDRSGEVVAGAVADLRESDKHMAEWERSIRDFERQLGARETALAAKSAESLGKLQNDMRVLAGVAVLVGIVGMLLWWKVGKGAGLPVVAGSMMAFATAIAVITNGDRIGAYSTWGLLAAALCVAGGMAWSSFVGPRTAPTMAECRAFLDAVQPGLKADIDELVAPSAPAVSFLAKLRTAATRRQRKAKQNAIHTRGD